MAQNHDLVALAESAARLAAAHIREARRPESAAWGRKSAVDFVTEIDRRAEQLIADALLSAEPESMIIGEEFTPDGDVSRGLAWVVDPLDGTTNYLHGYPMYAVSIAAVADGEPVAGVVLDVSRDLLYSAVRGGGFFLDKERLRVSSVTDPSVALIGTGFPFKRPALDHLDVYVKQFMTVLSRTAGIRRAGSAALDLVDTASGRFDGFWEYGLQAWDVAAGLLFVREAGGVATDLHGNPASVAPGPVVAGNPSIHAWLLETVSVVK